MEITRVLRMAWGSGATYDEGAGDEAPGTAIFAYTKNILHKNMNETFVVNLSVVTTSM